MLELSWKNGQLFHDGDPYDKEASPLICTANQWTGFCMIGIFDMKELTTAQKKTSPWRFGWILNKAFPANSLFWNFSHINRNGIFQEKSKQSGEEGGEVEGMEF